MMGPGFGGPLSLIVLIVYRLFQIIKNKQKIGTFINYKNSNWFDLSGNFKGEHLIPLAGNFIPNLAGLICLALAFKYAALGGLN